MSNLMWVLMLAGVSKTCFPSSNFAASISSVSIETEVE